LFKRAAPYQPIAPLTCRWRKMAHTFADTINAWLRASNHYDERIPHSLHHTKQPWRDPQPLMPRQKVEDGYQLYRNLRADASLQAKSGINRANRGQRVRSKLF
jgi:hypothetical protein